MGKAENDAVGIRIRFDGRVAGIRRQNTRLYDVCGGAAAVIRKTRYRGHTAIALRQRDCPGMTVEPRCKARVIRREAAVINIADRYTRIKERLDEVVMVAVRMREDEVFKTVAGVLQISCQYLRDLSGDDVLILLAAAIDECQ